MDLRPRIARRIIDRLQEFLHPMDDLEQDQVEEVIVDELSFKRDQITSRAGFVISTEDQDCVQAFLDLYPELRAFWEGVVLPKIRERFPDHPIRLEFGVPEMGFGGTYENRDLTAYVLFDYRLSHTEMNELFFPFREWFFAQKQDHPIRCRFHVWPRFRGSLFVSRLSAALWWMNVTADYLTHTVGLPKDLAERFVEGSDVSDDEIRDICIRLGISYEWVTEQAPTPDSAFECWDEFRTRKGE